MFASPIRPRTIELDIADRIAAVDDFDEPQFSEAGDTLWPCGRQCSEPYRVSVVLRVVLTNPGRHATQTTSQKRHSMMSVSY